MGKTVVLTEKPSAARNFAKALGGKSGTYENTDYEIVSLRGHVMGLVDVSEQVPEEKQEAYSGIWSLDKLPWNPDDIAWKKEPLKDAAEIFKYLHNALNGAIELCIATDVDPSGEGELLAWEAIEHVGWHGKTTRMYFADEAPKSIQKAFIARKTLPSMEDDGDWRKAVARERFDFLSQQFVELATCIARKNGCNFLVREGRLKSVMVALVGAQQEAHDKYQRVPYYEIKFKDENGNVFAVDPNNAIRKPTAAELDLSAFAKSPISVSSREEKHKAPGKLLDLAGLSAILATQGYKPKEVLATYQKMYEDQIVSYPRTEDKTITQEQFQELLPLVDSIANLVGVDASLLTHRQPRKGFVAEGGAHGANRPGTHVPTSLEDLSKYGPSAGAIYTTLAKNYLATLAEDYIYTLVEAHLDAYPTFVSSAQIPTSLGFKAIFDADKQTKDSEEDETGAVDFGHTASPFIYAGSNKRPQKPTMKWLKGRLEKYNVGTGATRTSTISDITSGTNALLNEKKGVLSLTACGSVSYLLLGGTQIASPEVTEKLFENMTRVGTGDMSVDDVVVSITPMVIHDKEKMLSNAPKLKDLGVSTSSRSEVIGKCPRCGQDIILSKSGNLYFCTSRKGHRTEDGGYELDTPGCGFKFASKVCGKRLTKAQAVSLLEGKTIPMTGLKSNAGKIFNANLKIDPTSEWGTMLDFTRSPKKRKKYQG